MSPILSLAHTHQVPPKAAELVRLLRKRAEAYRTNQLLLLVGDDFKWSQASLNLLGRTCPGERLLWLHLNLLWLY